MLAERAYEKRRKGSDTMIVMAKGFFSAEEVEEYHRNDGK
jgi:hypothetical protein